MKASRIALLLATFAAVASVHADEPTKLAGICFGAYRDGESPHAGLFPLPSVLEVEIDFTGKLAAKLRTYSVSNSHYLIPEICEEKKVECWPGAWLGRSGPANDNEIELLIRIGNRHYSQVKALIVGNEPLHRGDISEAQYLRYVERVKAAGKTPVTIAETWHTWKKHPKLAEAFDTLIIHVYPYWDEQPIEKGAAYTLDAVKEIQAKYPGKKVILGEFGWPSDGEKRGPAIASPENQARYLREVLPLLAKEKIDYFYFALWDENWKQRDEGKVGIHWGLFNADGSVKSGVKEMLPAEAREGLKRPGRRMGMEK
jgi:exo-beta-1,3-glucanase (GH17 family)